MNWGLRFGSLRLLRLKRRVDQLVAVAHRAHSFLDRDPF